jgi:methylphosphotriester-DNA--protein-cysteine methyltransferase
MTIPDTTSAEAIDHYVVGKRIAASRGTAWRDVRLSVIALPPVADVFTMPTVFKRATGMPPSQYQIKLRMDAARRLMRETKKSVITIANEVGVCDAGWFDLRGLFPGAPGAFPCRRSGAAAALHWHSQCLGRRHISRPCEPGKTTGD